MEKGFSYEHASRENIGENLEKTMEALSNRVNATLFHEFGQKALVDDHCRLMEASFEKSYQQGPYGSGDVKADTISIANQEIQWAGERGVEAWQKNKEKSKANQLEMVITLLLHKALGKDYIVVRASTYDDYFNGVDNLIVDKRTGKVVCAYDAFKKDPLDPERADAKERKMERKNAQGTTVKYGITIAKNKVERGIIENAPIFVLSIGSREFDDLLTKLDFDPEADLNDAEKQTIIKLGELLGQEYETLSQNGTASALGGVMEVARRLKGI